MESAGDRDKRGTAGQAAGRPTFDRSKLADTDAERNWWNTFREIYRTKGIDIEQLLSGWCTQETERLPSEERESFKALCDDGCHPFVLTAIVALFRHRSDLEAFWTLLVGSDKKRKKVRRTLDEAAAAINELTAGGLGRGEEEAAQAERLKNIGRIPPAAIVEELRLYGRMLDVGGSLARKTKVRSLEQFSLYLLSSYVDGATGRPHDGHVSMLIAEVNGTPGYTVQAHQRWRGRNLHKMHRQISEVFQITELLIAFGRVVPRPT